MTSMAVRKEVQGGLEGRLGAECAPPSSESHVIMWQVQIARTVVHVPIGQVPPPIDSEAEDGAPHAPFEMKFKPRMDHYMVVTEVAPGGPTDADGALQVGDLLINVNGKPVRGLGMAEVEELLAGPKPLLLTLGAEFRPGSGYAIAHKLFSGETLPVVRVGRGQARAAGPAEGAIAAPEGSKDQLGDGLPLTPRSSVRAAIPADPTRLCSDHSYHDRPPSTPQRSLSPRHDKENGLGNGPYQDAGLSGSPWDAALASPTAPWSPPGGAEDTRG